jgi:hypothetical protein
MQTARNNKNGPTLPHGGATPRPLLAAVTVFLAVGLTLAAAELLLRIASSYDVITLSAPVDILSRYRADWHHDRRPDRNKFDDLYAPEHCVQPMLNVLIAGDSWMEEPEFAKGLLARLRDLSVLDENLGNESCIRIINTGTGSFSPTPITIRLRGMLAEAKPDVVIINIDETDLMDEWIRYRHSTVLSSNGVPIAVTPFMADLPEMVHALALEAISDIPLYILRLVERAFLHGIFLPQVREVLRKRGQLAVYETILAPQRTKNAEATFRDAIMLFEARLKTLAHTVRTLDCTISIIFTHHPHFLHVSRGASSYPFSVSSIMRSALSDSGIMLYFAGDEMESVHGSGYLAEEVFQWPADPFSHLTPKGNVNFGRWVAEKITEDMPWRGRKHLPPERQDGIELRKCQ